MVTLKTLAKTIIVAALLNDTVKRTLATKLTRLIGGAMQTSTRPRSASQSQPSASSMKGESQPSYLGPIVEALLAILLLRSKNGKGGWHTQPLVISAIGALLATLLRPAEVPRSREQKKNVIDIDDYTVVDER